MTKLYHRSIEIILENQSDSGSYIASPNFPTYHYSWFRDSSFIAYAMDLAGEHESAARFHQWAAENILKREEIIQRAIEKAHKGIPLEEQDILHTRYSMVGGDSEEDWPNFQLDGFGTWLWALAEHQGITEENPSQDSIQAVSLLAEYLNSLWRLPCYDCWEEFPDKIHTYTLASIYAGLSIDLAGIKEKYEKTRSEISTFIYKKVVQNGHFTKFIGTDTVDASLIGVSVPYKLVSPTDQLMRSTIEKIEQDLYKNGGLHRYSSDTYFGGGQWVLLTAWLGWYYAEIGEVTKAEKILSWVKHQADTNYNLPEQVSTTMIDPGYYQPWVDRWGKIANPLLWTHAQYIILYKALEKARK